MPGVLFAFVSNFLGRLFMLFLLLLFKWKFLLYLVVGFSFSSLPCDYPLPFPFDAVVGFIFGVMKHKIVKNIPNIL